MNKWKQHSLLFLLFASALVLTGAGFAGEHSIYADYSRQNGWMTPAVSLVFQGLKDGVGPWELFSGAARTGAEADGAGSTADGGKSEAAVGPAEAESVGPDGAAVPAEEGGPSAPENGGDTDGQGGGPGSAAGENGTAGGVSENGISGNAVSENTVSGNNVSGKVSDNTVSENTISGNIISGNIISGNIISGNAPGETGSEYTDSQEEQASSEAAFTASDGKQYDRCGQMIGSGKTETGQPEAERPESEQTGDVKTEQSGEAQTGTEQPVNGAEKAGQESAAKENGGTSAGQESAQQGERPAAGADETSGEQPQEAGGKPCAFTQVQESYFDDALFIGDSRTVGMEEYGGFQESTAFFAKTSLTIYDLFEEPEKFARLTNGKKATLEEALTERKFGKIYIMLGINELGRGTTESFFTVYAQAVNRIRMLQPDALIFVQGIMRVGEEKSNTDQIFNNANINERNQALSLMADNRTIFYLEVNDAVCDENGNLISDYTFDQIHLKAKYYQLWKDYLFAHGILKN